MPRGNAPGLDGWPPDATTRHVCVPVCTKHLFVGTGQDIPLDARNSSIPYRATTDIISNTTTTTTTIANKKHRHGTPTGPWQANDRKPSLPPPPPPPPRFRLRFRIRTGLRRESQPTYLPTDLPTDL
ncbi:hypothetical protein LX32DRAFT_207682 [Colletotrichum zoysiae]|uniref:Uncharacterized protein n=1 Tax=Colletotrichum zoysiae TaxID=1216348 RepID=A0AAD9HQM7_9PEZI|nr:hypothetical protein LX32DRAFT_207682 [Colletotrichum zoysiae]